MSKRRLSLLSVVGLRLLSAAASNDAAAPKRRLLLAVEGNIGAGKSTLLRLLTERGMQVIDEPV